MSLQMTVFLSFQSAVRCVDTHTTTHTIYHVCLNWFRIFLLWTALQWAKDADFSSTHWLHFFSAYTQKWHLLMHPYCYQSVTFRILLSSKTLDSHSKGQQDGVQAKQESLLSSPFPSQPVCSVTCGEADLFLLLLEAPEARGKDFQVTSYCGSFFNLVGSHQGSGAKRRVRWRIGIAALVARTAEKFSSLPVCMFDFVLWLAVKIPSPTFLV